MAEDEDLQGEAPLRERSRRSRIADVVDELVIGERVEFVFGRLRKAKFRRERTDQPRRRLFRCRSASLNFAVRDASSCWARIGEVEQHVGLVLQSASA